MIFASATQFQIFLLWANVHLAQCLNSVLNVKALGAFNREKALGGAFSVIVKSSGTFLSSSNNKR